MTPPPDGPIMAAMAAKKKPRPATVDPAVAPLTPSGLFAMLLGDARSDEDLERLRVRLETAERNQAATHAARLSVREKLRKLPVDKVVPNLRPLRDEDPPTRRPVAVPTLEELRSLSYVVQRIADTLFNGGSAELSCVVALHAELMPKRERMAAACKWIEFARERLGTKTGPADFFHSLIWAQCHDGVALVRTLGAYDPSFRKLNPDAVVELVTSRSYEPAATLAKLAGDCGAFDFAKLRGDVAEREDKLRKSILGAVKQAAVKAR